MFTSWIISKQARHLACIVNHLYNMLIAFDFHGFHFTDSNGSIKGYMKNPKCVLSVMKNIYCDLLLLYPLLLCPAFATPPPPAHLLLFHIPPHSSFRVAPPLPLSSLLWLVHLPCRTEVRVRGQLPGCTTEPVLEGVLMYLRSHLILLFYIAWQLFPTGDGLTFTCSNPLCAHMCVFCEFSACMSVC